jgi:AcrR family transcriptional regulator
LIDRDPEIFSRPLSLRAATVLTPDRARWIDAALAAIETGGSDAVAVSPLARSLSVTKGSFYWHFADRRELLRAALGTWLTRHTFEAERRFGAITDPRQNSAAGGVVTAGTLAG